MGTYATLKDAIASAIKTNGTGDITGASLQTVLTRIVSTIGSYATYAGIAKPDTNPGNVDQNVFYLAVEQGTYQNFSNLVVKSPSILFYGPNKYWEVQPIAGNVFNYYSRSSTAFVSEGRLKIAISSPAGAKVLVVYNLLADDPSSLAIDFNSNYLSSGYSKCVNEIIVFISSNYKSSTISLGNTGLAPFNNINGLTSWSIPVKGTLVLQLTRSSSSDGTNANIMAIPLYLTPSTSGGGTSGSIADGSITTAKLASQAVTRDKLNQNVLIELGSAKELYEGTAVAELDTAWSIKIGPSLASEYRLNYSAEVEISKMSEDSEIYIGLSNDNAIQGIGKFILKIRIASAASSDRDAFETVFFDDIPNVKGANNSFIIYNNSYAVITFEYDSDYDCLTVTSVTQSPMLEASTKRAGLMSASDKVKLDTLPISTSMDGEQQAILNLKGSLGMHAAGVMQDLVINMAGVTESHSFFKHIVYVSKRENLERYFVVQGLNGFTIEAVYWRQFEDGGSYRNTASYPTPDQDGSYRISHPDGEWNLLQDFMKIEIEGFRVFTDSRTTRPVITMTITELNEL